jgi:hypothetical protein
MATIHVIPQEIEMAIYARVVMHRNLNSLGFIKLVSILFACAITVCGQTKPVPPPLNQDPSRAEKGSTSENLPDLGPLEEEIRVKRAIKLAENEYRENLERAREVAQIGAQLRDTYQQKKILGRDENKKLERMEKLAKRIRSEAGGSGEEAPPDPSPVELEKALARLAELSESLQKSLEKTPRQVVSAAVIEQVNVILELIKFARNAPSFRTAQ